MISQLKLIATVLRRVLTAGHSPQQTTYALTCDCGHEFEGQRRASWIEAECPSCFQSLFVLPNNVYPATEAVPTGVLAGSFPERCITVYRELRGPAADKTPKRPAVPSEADEKPVEEVPEVERQPFEPIKLIRRTLTPLRLIIVAMLFLVIGTGYWVVQQRRVEAARGVWLRTADEIDGLVDQRDFSLLEQTLSEAVEAGRILGRDDPDWRRTRNLLDETRAINALANDDLLGVFLAAYDAAGNLQSRGESQIREAVESGSFVMETAVRADSPEGFYSLDLPFRAGSHDVEIAAGLPALSVFLDAVPDGRALVSFRISKVVSPSSPADAWRLMVDPMSVTLLTTEEFCDVLGLSLEDDPELMNVVTRQRDFVSNSAEWDQRAGITLPSSETSP